MQEQMEAKDQMARSGINLEKLGVVTSDPKRAAIVMVLSDTKACMGAKQLEMKVEGVLHREISDGAFRWHLERLRSEDIIDLKEGRYCITPIGEKISGIVNPALKGTLETR